MPVGAFIEHESEDSSSVKTVSRLSLLFLFVIFSLGVFLRFFNFSVRNLWNDEGITVMFSRLSWPDVLGFNGQYDPHPPLYYAAVKLVGLFAPEQIAGRLLSVVAGSLTVLVLFELTRRLLTVRAALVAAFVLAISPIHVWYSQEARQYAITLLAVATSYLALIAYSQTPTVKWASVYGASTCFAVYLDYSAFYALVPQVALLFLVGWEKRKRSLPLFMALGLAVVCYLPWIPQVIVSVQQEGTSRASFLGLDAPRFFSSLGSLVGLQDQGEYFQLNMGQPWHMWGPLEVATDVAAVLVLALVILLAWKHSKSLLTCLLLTLGTVAVTASISLLTPTFAPRTIISAVLGWAIMLGIVVTSGYSPRWWKPSALRPAMWLGAALLILLTITSVVSLAAANAPFSLQRGPRWDELGADVSDLAIDRLNFRVVVPSKIDYALIDVYAPGVLQRDSITNIEDLDSLPLTNKDVWLAYHDTPKFQPFFDKLNSLGYIRISHQGYWPSNIFLDEYQLP